MCSSDVPCANGWYYQALSAKCYKLESKNIKLASELACKNSFNFDKTIISLLRLNKADDTRAIFNFLKSQSNNEIFWLDAVKVTSGYKWTDGSNVDMALLNSVATVVSLGDCLTFKYDYVIQGTEQKIMYFIYGVNCSDSYATFCEHKAKECDTARIPGYIATNMQLQPNYNHVFYRPFVACQFGYYRISEGATSPTASSDTSLNIPYNHANCTGTQDPTGDPSKYQARWVINQSYIEQCKKVSCDRLNGTINNVAQPNTVITSQPNQQFDFGYEFRVVCAKGFVNFEDTTNVNSSMKCLQSPYDKRQGIWSPNNLTPCQPVKCNSSQINEFEPSNGRLSKARNKASGQDINLNFQRYALPFYNVILTVRCDDGYFFKDRSWEKQIICGLKENSLTIGEWIGYLGSSLPLDKACQHVTCKFEDVLIKSDMNIEPAWAQMDEMGAYINKTEHSGEPYKFNTKLRFYCQSLFDTANQTPDQNLTCGPQGLWVPNLTGCIKKTDKLELGNKKRYIPPAIEASNAEEVGYVALVIVIIFLSLIIVLDMSTLSRDIQIMKTNIHQLRNFCKSRKSNQHVEPSNDQMFNNDMSSTSNLNGTRDNEFNVRSIASLKSVN